MILTWYVYKYRVIWFLAIVDDSYLDRTQTGTSKMQQSVYMRRLLDALIITHDTTNAR